MRERQRRGPTSSPLHSRGPTAVTDCRDRTSGARTEGRSNNGLPVHRDLPLTARASILVPTLFPPALADARGSAHISLSRAFPGARPTGFEPVTFGSVDRPGIDSSPLARARKAELRCNGRCNESRRASCPRRRCDAIREERTLLANWSESGAVVRVGNHYSRSRLSTF